jgi:hypothetical protein
MKIDTEVKDMNEYEKKHALKVLNEMLHCIDTIEESFVYFCTDADNKVAAKKLIEQLKADMEINEPIEEALVYLSVFKAKIMSEHKRLNISLNNYN